jgi:signal transduction histidine kinase
VSALADLQISPEGKRLVRQVERSLETMDELLRTLLDISKLDAGVVTPDYSELSIEQLFQSLRSDFQPLAEKEGLRLRFRPTNVSLTTDRSLFRRIVQNIISNAIRYTAKGGVLVAVRQRKESARIEIWDTGCGILKTRPKRSSRNFIAAWQ